jgi:hypothetical protein
MAEELDTVVGDNFDDYYAQYRAEQSPAELVLLEEAEAYYKQVNQEITADLKAGRKRSRQGRHDRAM